MENQFNYKLRQLAIRIWKLTGNLPVTADHELIAEISGAAKEIVKITGVDDAGGNSRCVDSGVVNRDVVL